jgi:hypothetical protein
MKTCLKIFLVFLFIFSLSITKVKASEGTVELESITAEDYRCFAASIQMLNWNYNILVTCRNLIYPAGDNIFQYVVWADPIEKGKPIKLGTLGLGRANFNTKTPFSSLFVTTEINKRVKEPEGPTVMIGNVERITFLDEPSPAEVIDIREDEEEITPALTTQIPTTSEERPTTTESNRLVRGLRRAGIVIGIALIVIVGIVFVLTRMRR